MSVLQKYSLSVAAGVFLAGIFYFPWLHHFVFLPPLLLIIFLKKVQHQEDAILGSWIFMFVAMLLISRALNPDSESWQFILRALNPNGLHWINLMTVLAWLFIAAWLALPFAVLGFLFSKLPQRLQLAGFAAVWAGAEFLRAKMFFGFTWASLGYFLFDASPSVGIYGRYVGVYGLSILTVLFAGLLFQSIEAKRILKPLLLFLILNSIFFVGGWWLRVNERSQWAQAKTPALVFQGELPWGSFGPYQKITDGFSLPKSYAGLFHRVKNAQKFLFSNSRELENNGGVIAVFPEEVLPPVDQERELYQWQEEKRGLEFVRQSLGASLLVIGQPVKQGETMWNASVVLDGDAPKIYAKRRLFPFIEYVPFGKHFVDRAFLAPPQRFQAGSGYGAGVLSCLEALLPDMVRKEVRAGAPILISGGSEIAWEKPVWEHNLLISRFHAMQNRRFLIRAMKEGYSAIVNPLGEVVIKSPGRGNVVLSGYVTLLSPQ